MGTPTIIALFYQLSIFSIFTPLHIHWLLKWRMHQNHFVIRHRFPQISIIAFVISFLVQISTIIFTILGVDQSDKLPLTAVNMTLTFIQEGFIFYRVHLLYVRYKTTSLYLKTMMESHSSASTDKIMLNKPKMFKCHAFFLNIMLIFIVIGAVITGVTEYFDVIGSQFAFLILLLSGIVIVVNMLRAKVKDSIACVQESLWTISICFAVIVVSILATGFMKTREQIAIFGVSSGFTLHVLVATLVLYIPLRLINKADPDADEGLVELSTKQSQSQDSEIEIKPSTSRKTNVHLMTFLKEYQNYKVFAEYLSRCFALENLLFCERVLILYHIILKYKKMDTEFMKIQNNEDNIPTNPVYELELNYLSDIYIEMDSALQNEVLKNDENEDMKYKKGILRIIGIIYKQFCCDDSPTQINIPYTVHDTLYAWFDKEEEKEISDQFDSYDKLLWIFNDALHETWAIAESVYSFRFQLYLKHAASD